MVRASFPRKKVEHSKELSVSPYLCGTGDRNVKNKIHHSPRDFTNQRSYTAKTLKWLIRYCSALTNISVHAQIIK